MKELQNYSGTHEILAVADSYVNIASTANPTDHTGIAVNENGRLIIKAGTIFPSNDGGAKGIVFHDVDITDGAETFPLLISGFINTAKIPAIPASAAKTAMPNVQFLPVETMVPKLSAIKAEVAIGTATGTFTAEVTLSTGSFRDAATTVGNWTIAAGATAMALDSVALSGDKITAYLNFKPSAAAVAGNVTAVPLAAAISTGVVPTTPVVVVTVA